MTISPVETELPSNALARIFDEMHIALMKSSYSTNIEKRGDHSTALFDATGRIVVRGESMPLHLASMLGLVEVVLEKYRWDSLKDGDMFLSNDPYVGRGSRPPDVVIAAPVFKDGEPAMFACEIAHHADIGSMWPGSKAGGMTEFFQEGVRIPPTRLFDGGTLSRDVMDLILLNVRVPEERLGGRNAQIAANRLALRRRDTLLDRRFGAFADTAAAVREVGAKTRILCVSDREADVREPF